MDDPRTFFEQRRNSSRERLASFRIALENAIGPDHHELIDDHTCVYVVGSGGRDELSPYSDLDLFLVKSGEPQRVDEVRLQSAIVHALDATPFVRPSNDAIFLKLHSARTLVDRMGDPRDDAENTFTARMLLLLESKPLVGEQQYQKLLSSCLDGYWKNTTAHAPDYLPIVLVNDIIRYWRILLLNYEAKIDRKRREREELLAAGRTAPSDEDLDCDRRSQVCKLRFSRCLMCYASILYLLAEAHVTRARTGEACITREATSSMLLLSPLERVMKALELSDDVDGVREQGTKLLGLYADFLAVFDHPKDELRSLFGDRVRRKPVLDSAYEFGHTMFRLLGLLGRDNPLYRYVVL